MTDLISRRAAIKAIDDLPNCYNGYSDAYDKAYIIGVIEAMPPIEPKRGEWKLCKSSIHPYGNDVECSACGFKMASTFGYSFCPNCGADMRDRSEE